jgi:hypothetical protein
MSSDQTPRPLLQIFHITDLHFMDDYDETARLIAERRWFSLLIRDMFAAVKPRAMHEGTLGHEDTAISAFSRLLAGMKRREKEWFPSGGQEGPQSWIVDTGDATTFGDARSMALAHKSLNDWRSVVAPAKLLSIVGNHDLWPGTQPGAAVFDDFASRMGVQRGQIDTYDLWNDMGPASPFVLNSSSGLSIELYSIGTISCEVKAGFLARGRVSKEAQKRLVQAVCEHGKPDALRILASHHPFAFPYDVPLFPSFQAMVLENPEEVAAASHPAQPDEPLIHVFLGGHTHVGMPGCPLPDHVQEVKQGGLGVSQVQLVSGPLLQQRIDGATNDDGPNFGLKSHPDFSDVSQIKGSQQFQLLRFYERSEGGDWILEVERIPFVRLVTEEDYVPLGELACITELYRRKSS